ncbi:MAG: ribonuclease III [Bacteroidales bacterium]|nr:ribonuclease III [Bacteroidales bacterium]MCF6342488.1 ribonuclease III [Bacteroidales bacterium]
MISKGFLKSFVSSEKQLLGSIRNIFGFYPDNIHLYKLALRHKSATLTKINGLKLNNERLEYLGDAILSAVVADYLFRRFPYKNEGFLTEMRSKIVSRNSLNKLSKKLGLQQLILSDASRPNHSKSAAGDAFEAFVGALYLDKGYRFARKVIINRIINIQFDMEQLVETELSYKSRMIEWAQKEKVDLQFTVVDEAIEKKKKQYFVAVVVNGETIAQSQDYSIKGAENIAAEKAWQKLSEKT